jgi:DNA-binding CsgD family transcriptional regulator
VAALRTDAEELLATYRALTATDPVDPRVRLVGAGAEGVARGLDRLERRARRSVWNMQRVIQFQTTVRYQELDRRTLDRGLDVRLVTTPATQQDNPLLTSIYPFVRLGPVFGPLLIVDGLCVVAPGSPDLDGNFTAWCTTDTAMVRTAVALWDRTWHLSRPGLEEGTAPPLTPRQVEVAQLLAQGFTDRVIARRVDVSERTVATDISRIARAVGAPNRAAAAAMVAGSISR